jgi:phosphotransferase system IIB component
MDYYQRLAIIIASIVVIIALVVTILLLTRKKKKKQELEFPLLLDALGGKENIKDLAQKGSRVSVIVENKKIVDKDKVREQGIETIVVSNKKFTMLAGSKKSQLMYNYLKNQIELD